MLLARYGLDSADCDTIDIQNNDNSGTQLQLATGMVADTWDFSGKNLSSFAVTDDDAKYLKKLMGGNDGTRIAEAGVRYIDLTGNSLTAADVNFKHIPSNVAVKLTADSNVKGFQLADYTITEGGASYVAAALPDLLTGPNTHFQVTVGLTGDVTKDVNEALDRGGNATRETLVSFGTGTGNSRILEVDSDSGSVIYHWPITVSNDNETEDDWEITLTINEDTGVKQGTSASNAANATAAAVSLAIDQAEVTILDADEPATIVCNRSEDVEASILQVVAVSGNEADFGGTTNNPRDCDELTKRDLSKITQLWVADDDTDDMEPLETLLANDFADLTGLYRLHIVGARALPSGIFAGVGKDSAYNHDDDDGTTPTVKTTEITFAKNQPEDPDDDSVGNFTPSTIPQHIWDDQEAWQVITLSDDKDSSDKGVTKGLDADLYAGAENGHFFVLTNAATAKYVLGTTTTFASTEIKLPEMGTGTITANNTVGNVDPIGANTVVLGAVGEKSSRVVRFAVSIDDVDDEDKGDRTSWIFLFGTGAANVVGTNDPTNAGDLKDIAAVAITDDD